MSSGGSESAISYPLVLPANRWKRGLKLVIGETLTRLLPGRAARMPVPPAHFVLGTSLAPPFPAGIEQAMFGLGCFWGAERKFWQLPGVHSTAVGYAAGHTPNPTYEEVCSGMTGHNEVVLVAFDPARVGFDPARNPVHPVSGIRMVDPNRIFVWTWDMRPFPAFPELSHRWAR